jgi:hypothetical protein
VLSGGIVRTSDEPFHDRVRRGIEGVAPLAVVSVLQARPVLGAALLGLDMIGAGPQAAQRLRAAMLSSPDHSR